MTETTRDQLKAHKVLREFLSELPGGAERAGHFIVWVEEGGERFCATLGGDPRNTLLCLEFYRGSAGVWRFGGSSGTRGDVWTAMTWKKVPDPS